MFFWQEPMEPIVVSPLEDDISLLGVLCEMGVISADDRPSIEYVIEEHAPERRDLFATAYLINHGYVSERQLVVAEAIIRQLKDPDPVEKTKARVSMVKAAAREIRHQIRGNTELSKAILKDGRALKKKSTSSEYLAVGFLTDKSGPKL